MSLTDTLTLAIAVLTALYVLLTAAIALAAAAQVRAARQQVRAAEAQAAAARQQAEDARAAHRMAANLQVLDRTEATRADRHAMRDYVRDRDAAPRGMTAGEARAADRVCRAYDILGVLDRLGHTDRDFIGDFYARSFVRMYDAVLRGFVESERRRRGPTHFWELSDFYERMRTWAEEHPHPSLAAAGARA